MSSFSKLLRLKYDVDWLKAFEGCHHSQACNTEYRTLAPPTFCGPVSHLNGARKPQSSRHNYAWSLENIWRRLCHTLASGPTTNSGGYYAYRIQVTPCFIFQKPVQVYETIIVHLEEQKGVGRVLSHCLQPSRKFQHVTCVLVGLVWVSAKQWHWLAMPSKPESGDARLSKPWVKEKVVRWHWTNRTGSYSPAHKTTASTR